MNKDFHIFSYFDRQKWFCILALALITLILASCSPNTPAPKRATAQRLKEVQYVIRTLEDANRLTIEEQLREIAGGTTLQEKWEILLIDNADKFGREPKTIRRDLCRDYWGNRFNVEFKTNLTAGTVSTALAHSPFDVVIWSSGENRTNEFGNGDDVVLSLPAVNK